MNKLRVLLIALLLFSGYNVEAQSSSIPNILNLRSIKQKGPILEGEKLVGYYVFYFKEKNDRKTSTYEVEIFDDNYNSVSSYEITRPKRSYLMETVYNGEVFMLFFYDAKNGYEFLTYNKSGEEVGSHKVERQLISSFDFRATQAAVAKTDEENITIYPMGNSGFIRQTFTKNKKMGYALVAYDNELNVNWTYESPAESKIIQLAEITDVSEKYITATVVKKKNVLTKKMNHEFILLDASTGELIKNVEMGNKEVGKKMILRSFFDEKEEKIVLIGEFFKPGDDFLKDKSQGIFIKELSEEGNNISMTEYAWKGEIDQFKNDNLTEEDRKDSKASFSIFFHKVIRSDNGHLFLIGEQFRKQVSAGGVAMNVLAGATGGSSNVSNFEVRVSNMIVIELDEENKLIDYKIIKKKRTSVFLPEGYGLVSSATLGYYVKSIGGFDYEFTSSDTEKDEFTIIYKDYDRKEKKGAKNSDVMIGIIHIKAGKLESQRIPINTEAKSFWIMPAKPGHISIMEYFRNEKRFDMRLEKLVY